MDRLGFPLALKALAEPLTELDVRFDLAEGALHRAFASEISLVPNRIVFL